MQTITNRLFCITLLFASVLLAQPTKPAPEFEAVSVHKVDPSEQITRIAAVGGPGTRTLQAYQILPSDRFADDHFMMTAKIAANSTKEEVRAMMQRFLKERFGFSGQLSAKKMSGFALLQAKGGAKVPASVIAPPAIDAGPDTGADKPQPRSLEDLGLKKGKDGLPMLPADPGLKVTSDGKSTRMQSNQTTMDDFAKALSNQLQPREPVVNQTSLAGKYDVSFTFGPDTLTANTTQADSSWPPLPEALVSQLGLKLERQQVTVTALTVMHIEHDPTTE